jgi:hypothetical protein
MYIDTSTSSTEYYTAGSGQKLYPDACGRPGKKPRVTHPRRCSLRLDTLPASTKATSSHPSSERAATMDTARATPT